MNVYMHTYMQANNVVPGTFHWQTKAAVSRGQASTHIFSYIHPYMHTCMQTNNFVPVAVHGQTEVAVPTGQARIRMYYVCIYTYMYACKLTILCLLQFMDRQKLQCPEGKLLSGMQMVRCPNNQNQARYSYSCCKPTKGIKECRLVIIHTEYTY
jgi:hypothetical protein